MTMPVRPIRDVAEDLGVSRDLVEVGAAKAKVSLDALEREPARAGRIVLVSAITPTAHGEGKTTVSVALAMALCRLGRRAVACLRQPSLGPVFGIKGGATGGGLAKLVPEDEINLHFTGDFHAISSAHNLLAALVDNDIHFRGRLDPRRVTWPRAVDMNDRALRHVVIGLGGPNDGVPRESRFEITAASEVMAVLCLARSSADLRERLGRIIVGRSPADLPVTASDLGAVPAMEALLHAALLPNLAQTCEGTPALVHGGPFANIAHGCSSVLATALGAVYADDVITEAGFGFDLGGEKFLHLKCPAAGVWPRALVLVATVRALSRHGGEGALGDAVERGLRHLDKQIDNVRAFGIVPIVALNVFLDDTERDLWTVERHCNDRGIPISRVEAFAKGSSGALDLASKVARALDDGSARPSPVSLYRKDDTFDEKLRKIARTLYGAREVLLTPSAIRDLERFERWGYGSLPPCVAKTQLSLSGDPHVAGVPEGFDLTVTSVRLSAGAGFLVALAGDIQTMPGLPHDPAALHFAEP